MPNRREDFTRLPGPPAKDFPELTSDNYSAAQELLDRSRHALLRFLSISVDANFSSTGPIVTKPNGSSAWLMRITDRCGDLTITQETPLGNRRCINVKLIQGQTEPLKFNLTQTTEELNEETPDVIVIGEHNYLIRYVV